jgi:UDP-glucose 4-epimerase
VRVRSFGRVSKYRAAPDGVDLHIGEFGDRVALARALEGVDTIFHLLSGSIPESSNRDPAADLSGSVIPTLNLLDCCRSSQVKNIVFVSSGGTVYGPAAPIPTPETAATDPVSAYGVSRLATEKYLRLYNHLYKMDYKVLRVANPYGQFQDPDRRQGVIGALMSRVILGQDVEIWGDGEIVRDFIHINDVIDAIIGVAGYTGSFKLFNVGSGVGRSINQVVGDIIKTAGTPKTKVIYRAGRKADVPTSVLDIELIRRELDWVPRIGWCDGLRMTADWLRQR